MQFFDLHCDTLYKAATEGKTLDEPHYEVSFSKGNSSFTKWRECTAIWIPDNMNILEMRTLFESACGVLRDESKRLSVPVNDLNSRKNSFILTVENGALIGDDITYIRILKEAGVKMLTLTWNAENSIGGGADAQGVGLKPFGKLCVKTLESEGIIIDVSHASDRLFWDVAEIANKPFVASHSNSRSVCNHRRNLTDEQFEYISKIGGLVGLNFHVVFLNDNPSEASADDILKHAYHFLSLGGENTLAIGSDFDGATMPKSIGSIAKIENLYNLFIKQGFNEQVVQKIMHDNAHNFFSKF